MTRFFVLLALAAVSACVEPVDEPAEREPAPPEPARLCVADGAAFAVGRVYDEALREEARVRSGSKIARALRPNELITLEGNLRRLNLVLDEQGRVSKVNCG